MTRIAFMPVAATPPPGSQHRFVFFLRLHLGLLLRAIGALGVPSTLGQVVINEIHYDPPQPATPAEFVELHNPGTTAIHLGGWQLAGGMGYTFVSGTMLPPGGYLVVAQDPTTLKRTLGADSVGPWEGRLSNEGDRVELLDAQGNLQDRVEYQLGFPWPTVGDAPGNSIELIHPSLDNNLGGHWRASVAGGSPAGGRTVLVAPGAVWRFQRGTGEASVPVTAWRQPGFNDSGWGTGPTPIGYDPAVPLATRLADMPGSYTSVFFRKTFDVTDPGSVGSLEFQALYDDGFKVWLNGTPLLDANMAGGEVPYDGVSGPARESNAYDTLTAVVPPGVLKPTGNVLAIQAHNVSLGGSSDFFLDLGVVAVRGATGVGPTPGRRNRAWSTEVPPAIRQVSHRPSRPRSGEPVVVRAKVTDADGVGSVTLRYQVVRPGAYIALEDPAYETDWSSLPMRDDGRGGDDLAGDGEYAATIPAAAQTHRTLVRYRVEASDTGNRSVRVPYPDDPQPNFAFFCYDGVPAWSGRIRPGDSGELGRVLTVTSNEMNRLPVLHLLASRSVVEEATWRSRYGGDAYRWGGTLVFEDQVYDHVRYRARGGVWRYAMTKNMWKFDFNRGHSFRAVDDWGRKLPVAWSKLNLGASIQQGDFNHRGEQGMFESTGFRIFRLAGVPAVRSAFAQFRVIDQAEEAPASSQYDGDFWGLYLMLEQPDGRFLEQNGMPDGNLYKMEGGSGELNNAGPDGPLDKSDLNAFLNTYSSGNEAWWWANTDVPNYLSYQTVVQAIHHYDICYDKNFFYYRNPETARWQVVPWDLDLTWAENMYDAGCGGVDRFKQRLLPNATKFPATWRAWQNRIREFRDLFWNEDEAWRLIEEQAGRLRGPASGPTLLDADRAQWDYNPRMIDPAYSSASSKAGQGRFYSWPNYPSSVAARSFEGCLQIMRRYVGFRATNDTARARALDLLAADDAIPATPTLSYAGPEGFPVNALRFRTSEYSGRAPFRAIRWRIGEITRPSLTGPAWQAEEPWKYELEPVWESGPVTSASTEIQVPAGVLRTGRVYRARVLVEDTVGRTSHWSEPVEFVAGVPDSVATLSAGLRLTELMYHAMGGPTNDFVELHNAGPIPLVLDGVAFTQGIEFTFPTGTTLAPGAYLVVSRADPTANFAGFRARYGLDATVRVMGPYAGNLSDAGETLTLRASPGGPTLFSVSYSDGPGWPLAADGAGHSLVPRRDFGTEAGGALDFGGNWRASADLGGSPGRADREPATSLLLNEVVAHTDFLSEFDSNDSVEVYNPGATDLVLGPGWYLSDDGDNLRKWAIPASTRVPARGWVVFDEVTGFNNPRGTGFSLNKDGEQVFLSRFPAGEPGRVVDALAYAGQENDWAVARVPDGGDFWDQVIPRTPGRANATPPPRVAISELLYHEGGLPTNRISADALEFVELHNDTAAAAPLYNTNGLWRIRGGISFDFTAPVVLAAGERILLVSFDPIASPTQLAGFRATLSVPPTVRVFGPYSGRLQNDVDRVALQRPQAPDLPGEPISWVIVDEVRYFDRDPWPGGADGTGKSYQRHSSRLPGSNPVNWVPATPTPGTGPASTETDTDADGMPDAWETAHGFDPRDPADAALDADGDGLSNRAEFVAGTDPRDAASLLTLRVAGAGGTGLMVSFTAASPRAYVVEVLDPAEGGAWRIEHPIPEGVEGRTVSVAISVLQGPAARWFRVRVVE